MKIDKMKLADKFTPQAMAAAVIHQWKDVPIPIPVEDIAYAVGIKKILVLDLDKIEGSLSTDSDKNTGAILVNKRSRVERRRFTIGHELGHFLILDHFPENADKFLCTPEDMRETDTSQNAKRMETEANIFSANLLMPTAIFRKDVRSNGHPSIKTVLQLAGKYKTSKEATANRYVHMIEKSCAVIFSKDEVIRYVNTNADFAWLKFKEGETLPNHMLDANRQEEVEEVSEVMEQKGYIWCDENKNQLSPEYIFEQTIAHRNGYRMTLLYYEIPEIEGEIEEKFDEERELIESWTPKFRR